MEAKVVVCVVDAHKWREDSLFTRPFKAVLVWWIDQSSGSVSSTSGSFAERTKALWKGPLV